MVNYTSSAFEITPEGEYNCEIINAEEYNNPNGKNKIIVDFKYTDPETMEDKTHKEFVIPVVSDGDKFRVFSDLMALAGEEAQKEGAFDESKLIGLGCKITIGHTTYNGTQYANVLKVEKKTQ